MALLEEQVVMTADLQRRVEELQALVADLRRALNPRHE
jgi:hypothetical protein